MKYLYGKMLINMSCRTFMLILCLFSLIFGIGCERNVKEEKTKNLRVAVWGPPEELEKFSQNLKEY